MRVLIKGVFRFVDAAFSSGIRDEEEGGEETKAFWNAAEAFLKAGPSSFRCSKKDFERFFFFCRNIVIKKNVLQVCVL